MRRKGSGVKGGMGVRERMLRSAVDCGDRVNVSRQHNGPAVALRTSRAGIFGAFIHSEMA
jgi:hypothetical protein